MSKLNEVIGAMRTTERELRHHAERLRERTTPDTEHEQGHIADLAERYEEAARVVAILRRYQEGRVRDGRDSDGGAPPAGGVDERGVSGAYL